jgi:hypothetical protein
MFKIILSLFLIIAFFKTVVFSQDGIGQIAESESLELDNDSSNTSVNKHEKKSNNVNIDMQLIYGQYNTMLSTINYSHEEQDFVYLISSYLKRSDDYGYQDDVYKNSGYYENNIGFTGNINASDTWKIILDANVENDSRGMFDNIVYNHEDKEKNKLSFKNIKKIKSYLEGYFDLSYAGYSHRLDGHTDDQNKHSELSRYDVKIGSDFIWSATNRVKTNILYTHYEYTDDLVERDQHIKAEITDDFIITNYIGVKLGLLVSWNKDYGYLDIGKDQVKVPFLPIVGLSLRGLKNLSVAMRYRYDLKPFTPEEYFFAQKYVLPVYDLPPSKVHNGECRADLRFNSVFSLKSEFIYERSDNFYNYQTTSGNVLTAETLEATSYVMKIDNQINLIENTFQLILGYKYSYYNSDKNITYSPENIFKGTLKINSGIFNLEWTNQLLGKVFVDPESDEKLDKVVLGSLGVQFKTMASLFAYMRVENLYNNEYSLRKGYPESGRTFLGGLRILL